MAGARAAARRGGRGLIDALDGLAPQALGLGAALGAGLLIGLERERRKGQGPGRGPAGIRSFTLVALLGAIVQWIGQPLLLGAAALAVVALAALAYWRSPAGDPGVTTEVAMVLTFAIGVLAMEQPAWGAGLGAVVAALLAARDRMHRFATQWLTEGEMQDAVLLAALALVLAPLMPASPVAWLGGLQPRTLVGIAVLILLLQGAGHLAARVAGARTGLALAGFGSGFVSSTATIASMGARAREQPAHAAACEAGAILSTASTWVQALVLLLALAPPLTARLLPGAVAALAVAATTAWWRARQAPGGPPAPPSDPQRGPLRLREAFVVAALLAVIALAVGAAATHFGDRGVLVAGALGALADAHATVATLGTLQADGRLGDATALTGVLLAIGTNAVSRSVVAFVSGGRGYGSRVALSLAASTAAAAGVLYAAGRLAIT